MSRTVPSFAEEGLKRFLHGMDRRLRDLERRGDWQFDDNTGENEPIPDPLDVQHITAIATTGQTFATSGTDVEWSSVVSSPAERDGTDTTVPTTQVGALITGRRLATVHLIFDAEHTGTVRVVRVRNGSEAVLAEESGTGSEFYATFHVGIRPGDHTLIRVTPTAAATLSWGRIQATDIEDGQPTDEVTTYLAAYNGAPTGNGPYKIGVAWSDDGDLWVPSASNPVLSPAASGQWDDAQVKDPHIAYVDGTFHMLYAGFDGANWRIGYATSTDGETWTRQGQVLGLGSTGSFDALHVVGPTVYYDPDDVAAKRWKVWYGAADASDVRRVGYAYGPDLASLTKHGQVLDVGAAGNFDDVWIHPGAVAKVGSTWHLLVCGMPEASGHLRGWQPGVVTFADPESTYTNAASPAFTRRTAARQALTSNLGAGDTTATVADSSVFEVGEPVVFDSSTSAWALAHIVSIDSPGQITLSGGPSSGTVTTGEGGFVASLFYGSLVPRSVRQLADGTWVIYGTAFQFGSSDELAEAAVSWTAPTLTGTWTPNYAVSHGGQADGVMFPFPSWSSRSAENPSVVEVVS